MHDRQLSVIIPVYNDPDGIARTLDSLGAQPRAVSTVTVVDNGSTDGTRGVVEGFDPDYLDIRLQEESDIQSSYAARNTGIKNSNADILAFLDADETVDEDWLETALEAMNEQDVDYLGCNVQLTLPEDTLVGRYNKRTGFPVKDYLENEHFAPTCALLVRREVFEDVGLFDERLISGGDMEFGQRVHKARYDQG
jgi:glycosyltransferase involved in cell wall biosynthesis